MFTCFPGANLEILVRSGRKCFHVVRLFNIFHQLRHIPNFDRVVEAARRQNTIVSAKVQRMDRVLMRAKVSNQHGRGQIPDEHGAIVAARRQKATTIREL